MDRELIYSTIWKRVNTLSHFRMASRRIIHWSELEQKAQPALFMVQVGETAIVTPGLPTQWRFNIELHIYARNPPEVPPGVMLNPLIDAVCNRLQKKELFIPPIQWCRVEGRIDIDEGEPGDQLAAVIPVVIGVLE